MEDLDARRAAAGPRGLMRAAAGDGAAARFDAVVVGAGWAGLAAAVELVAAGRRVAVLDAAPGPGGRARAVTLRLGGVDVDLDNGQHLMIGAYRECLRLAARVGVPVVDGDADVDAARPALRRLPLHLSAVDGLSLATAALPAPWHLLVGLARARGLSMRERWAATRLMLSLRAHRWRTRPGETVAALLGRLRQPASLRRRLWEPLALAALNTGVDDACAQAFAAVLRDALGAAARDADLVLPTGTLGEAFPAPAARWLAAHGAVLRWRTTARALVRDDEGWRVDTDAGAVHADAVVLAVPPAGAARLLAPVARTAAQRVVVDALARFAYESLATVYLAWPQAACPALPRWIMLDDSAGPQDWGQWLFDRGTRHGMRVAAVVVSARGRLAHVPADALAEGIAAQVAAQLRLPAPADRRTIVEKRATFRCAPDRPRLDACAFAQAGRARAAGTASGHEAPVDRLWLAGDYAWPEYPATLEAAVRSGVAAARALCAAARVVAR